MPLEDSLKGKPAYEKVLEKMNSIPTTSNYTSRRDKDGKRKERSIPLTEKDDPEMIKILDLIEEVADEIDEI